MVYDLIILGAGAAGMSASIYASRYKMNHLIFGDKVGGQFLDAHIIANYPGFTSIEGPALTAQFRQHVESYGVKIREEKVGQVSKLPIDKEGREGGFEVTTATGEKFQGKTLLLAMGARHRALNVPGEENYLGRGVSYCSTCDAPLFRGKVVAVVGGGNSAITAALHIAEFATQVYLIHRRDTFDKADPVWLEALEKKTNVTKILNTQLKEIFGNEGPKQLTNDPLASRQQPPSSGREASQAGHGQWTNEERGSAVDSVRGVVLSQPFSGNPVLSLDGVFIEVGLIPAASLANQLGVEVLASGYIKTKGDLSTNVPGVFAAGDLVQQSDVPQFRQIITSAAQGTIAVATAYSYLNQKAPGPDWG